MLLMHVNSGEDYKFLFTVQPFTLGRIFIKVQINIKTIIKFGSRRIC